jgi:hypothetical protein
MLSNELFNCKNKHVYPPFKNGLYLEEFFFKYVTENNPLTKRKYIPVLWTNFQIEDWFDSRKVEMQQLLDEWVKNNPSPSGYFTVVQYDDGPKLRLPDNTIVYGACSGDVPIPLIYQDIENKLTSITKKRFSDKRQLCSFVGNITSNHIQPNVRYRMFEALKGSANFKMIDSGGWSPDINLNLQDLFIQTTIDSKFALAPRGYGRSSFRFFECFQLGTIPVYIWNDVNWLPFQDIIDYNRLCVNIHISKINELENILLSIDETKYNNMFGYYNEIKYLFTVEGLTEQIIKINACDDTKISLCIPTKNRFDDFLTRYLDEYVKYLQNGIIDEIVICDETGDDYSKIIAKYGSLINNDNKFKVYQNNEVLGVFKNKLKVCSLAKNDFIALIDSDNFADEDYFKTAKSYIEKNNLQPSTNFILAPSWAKPNFDYTKYNNVLVNKENIKHLFHDMTIQCCMNTGNYILNKSFVGSIKYDDSIMKQISACDVLYFNLLAFQQISSLTLHVVPNLHYTHVVHDDSEYLKTNHLCAEYRDNVIIPKFYNL